MITFNYWHWVALAVEAAQLRHCCVDIHHPASMTFGADVIKIS